MTRAAGLTAATLAAATAITIGGAAAATAKTTILPGYSDHENTVYVRVNTDTKGRRTATAYTENTGAWKTKKVTLYMSCRDGSVKGANATQATSTTIPRGKRCTVTATAHWKRYFFNSDTASVKVATR